jgi:hypothetical protein
LAVEHNYQAAELSYEEIYYYGLESDVSIEIRYSPVRHASLKDIA